MPVSRQFVNKENTGKYQKDIAHPIPTDEAPLNIIIREAVMPALKNPHIPDRQMNTSRFFSNETIFSLRTLLMIGFEVYASKPLLEICCSSSAKA